LIVVGVLLTKPFSRAQLGERVRAVLDSHAAPSGDRVALVVEDEPLVRMVLVDALEDRGFEVVQTASAREGIAAAERLVALQVAFVDVGLPDRSGVVASSSQENCDLVGRNFG
jgi:DNA-binding response OmpR family regulator